MCKWILVRDSEIQTSLVVQWLRLHLPMQGRRFDPWSGKIQHAAEQWNLSATTSESTSLEPGIHSKKGHRNVKPVNCNKMQPLLAPARENSCPEMKTQSSEK